MWVWGQHASSASHPTHRTANYAAGHVCCVGRKGSVSDACPWCSAIKGHTGVLHIYVGRCTMVGVVARYPAKLPPRPSKPPKAPSATHSFPRLVRANQLRASAWPSMHVAAGREPGWARMEWQWVTIVSSHRRRENRRLVKSLGAMD